LEQLVSFAKEAGVRHVVYSPVKIVSPRLRAADGAMGRLKAAFGVTAAPEELVFRGGSWRLPGHAAALVTEPFLELCRKQGVVARCCMANLVQTR
jgi:hypothetical protein